MEDAQVIAEMNEELVQLAVDTDQISACLQEAQKEAKHSKIEPPLNYYELRYILQNSTVDGREKFQKIVDLWHGDVDGERGQTSYRKRKLKELYCEVVTDSSIRMTLFYRDWLNATDWPNIQHTFYIWLIPVTVTIYFTTDYVKEEFEPIDEVAQRIGDVYSLDETQKQTIKDTLTTIRDIKIQQAAGEVPHAQHEALVSNVTQQQPDLLRIEPILHGRYNKQFT